MHVFEQADDQLKNNKNTPEKIQDTPRQQRAQDALELAEVIYGVFKKRMSNARILDESRKDGKNV